MQMKVKRNVIVIIAMIIIIILYNTCSFCLVPILIFHLIFVPLVSKLMLSLSPNLANNNYLSLSLYLSISLSFSHSATPLRYQSLSCLSLSLCIYLCPSKSTTTEK